MSNATLPAIGIPVATRQVTTPGGDHVQYVGLDVGNGDNTGSRAVFDRGTIPRSIDPGVPVRPIPADFWRCGFSGVGAGLVTTDLTLLQTGAGMTVSQAGGNLVIATGTTANAETVIRSNRTFRGGLAKRFKMILSQRIANQTFRVELADLVGDALAYTINSATSVTVSFPAGTNPFTAANVGQSMRLSRIAGAAGVPGRYAIASVSGDTVTFTVAGWPASGTGTLSLYGRNSMWAEYSGTTATNAIADAARDGWASGNTTLTINTTASPGHVLQLTTDTLSAAWSDALVASATAQQWTARGNRIENIPDDDVELYLFIVVQNGSTAPASTTTMTMGYVQVEMQGRQKVRIATSDQAGATQGVPVNVQGVVPVSMGTNTPQLSAGTNRAGFVAGAGIWFDDTSTSLAANATFTGTSRDLTVTATATAFANAATYAQELRVSAEADVSGTLWLEVSRDNTTWRRVKSVPTAAVAGGGHYAEIVHRPSWRYARVGFTNGATVQARLTVGSVLMAA